MAETIAAALIYYATGTAAVAGSLALVATTVLVGIGISVGTSLLAQQFMSGSRSKAPSQRQFVTKGSAQTRMRHYGRVRIAGAQVFAAVRGGSFYRVIAHADGEIDAIEQRLINETEVTVDSGTGLVQTAQWLDRVRLLHRMGTADQTAYGELTAAFTEWTTEHRGRGIAHSLIEFKKVPVDEFPSVYPSGESTSVKITIRGAKVWDPRDPLQDRVDPTTRTWTDNPALCVLDWLQHSSGMRMPWAWLAPELDAWIAAADACDVPVPLAAGGTEPRYRLSGSYDYDERPAEVLGRMLAACNGRIWAGPNGGITISVGAYDAPTVTLDDDAIVKVHEIGAGNDALETANTLRAVYTDPAQGYVETDADPWIDAEAVAQFGERAADAQLYMVPSHGQCRRLMKQALARLAPDWRGTLTTNMRGLPALTERFVRLRIGRLDIDIIAEIDDVQFAQGDGGVITGLVIAWTSIDPASMTEWDPEAEEGTPATVPPVIADDTLDPPANFVATVASRGSYAVIVGSWDAYSTGDDHIEMQWRVDGTGDDAWQSVLSAQKSTTVESGALIDGADYEVRARGISGSLVSAWTSMQTVMAVADGTPPAAPTDFNTAVVASDVTITWTNPNSANCAGARVYRHTSDVPAAATLIHTDYSPPSAARAFDDEGLSSGTYFWWVASINASGVESARTAAGSETIP